MSEVRQVRFGETAVLLDDAPSFDAAATFDANGDPTDLQMQPRFFDIEGVDGDFADEHGLPALTADELQPHGWSLPWLNVNGLGGGYDFNAIAADPKLPPSIQIPTKVLLKGTFDALQSQEELKVFDDKDMWVQVIATCNPEADQGFHWPNGLRLYAHSDEAVLQATAYAAGIPTSISTQRVRPGEGVTQSELGGALSVMSTAEISLLVPARAGLGQVATFGGGTVHWVEKSPPHDNLRFGLNIIWNLVEPSDLR